MRAHTEHFFTILIKCGYRHIDCAYCYGNEKEVGEGIKAAGVERSQLFITSKLWNNKHHPEVGLMLIFKISEMQKWLEL